MSKYPQHGVHVSHADGRQSMPADLCRRVGSQKDAALTVGRVVREILIGNLR